MAHLGQELALGLDRGFGIGFGAAQFVLGRLVLADVLNGAGVAAAFLAFAGFITNGSRAAGNPARLGVGAYKTKFLGELLVLQQTAAPLFKHPGSVLLVNGAGPAVA